jgi:hypothetical protein
MFTCHLSSAVILCSPLCVPHIFPCSPGSRLDAMGLSFLLVVLHTPCHFIPDRENVGLYLKTIKFCAYTWASLMAIDAARLIGSRSFSSPSTFLLPGSCTARHTGHAEDHIHVKDVEIMIHTSFTFFFLPSFGTLMSWNTNLQSRLPF